MLHTTSGICGMWAKFIIVLLMAGVSQLKLTVWDTDLNLLQGTSEVQCAGKGVAVEASTSSGVL